jgi:hypothetical protein
MAYLLDTDIVIYWLTDRFPQIQEQIDRIERSHIFFSASALPSFTSVRATLIIRKTTRH